MDNLILNLTDKIVGLAVENCELTIINESCNERISKLNKKIYKLLKNINELEDLVVKLESDLKQEKETNQKLKNDICKFYDYPDVDTKKKEIIEKGDY